MTCNGPAILLCLEHKLSVAFSVSACRRFYNLLYVISKDRYSDCLFCDSGIRDIKYMDWKRFRNLRVPENHPCCAYMDSELVSLLLTRTNMTWMLIPVDGFQGV